MLNQLTFYTIIFQDKTQVTGDVNSGLFYLLAAYAVVWLFIFGYLYSLNRRQNRLRHEIDLLQQGENDLEEPVQNEKIIPPNPRQTGG